MKTYFISGGTGSFGKELSSILLKNKLAKKIIIFSRDEFKQDQMKKLNIFKKNEKIMRYFIGDVRDKNRISQAMSENKIDIVIHAAALKQVHTTEYNPFETIKTNILGAQNIIESSLENNIKKVVALSTDKACSPINLYGATKLASDKLFTAANLFKGGKKTILSVVRYGNVLGSRGSVVPIFLTQNESKSPFTITDKNMTRFNITLAQAIKFVIQCINKMKGGEIFVPKIPSYKILDLVKAVNDKKTIKYIGLRPGEKIHEEMISTTDAINSKEFKDYFIIYPSYTKINNKKKISNYSSNKNKHFLSIKEIRRLIKNNYYSFELEKK
jgi:UDP-N-acetylglucosamine 4,6-dehydratase/5-epimerase